MPATHAGQVAKIVPLVPPLPEGGAVLAVQATVLRGGLAIGVTIHHAACDGVSSTHFLRTWAWAAAPCSGASAPEPPFVDRSIIRARDDLYDAFTAPRLSSNDDDDTGGKPAAPGGGRAYFRLPADHRTRLEPPVPDEYLGNCLGPCIASAPRKDVAAAGADGLFTACAAIATAIDGVVRGGAAYWDGWMERIIEAYSAGDLPLTVAGSPRFRVYDTDFGFGRPAKVDVVSVARTGAMSVAEARSGGGGVEPPGPDEYLGNCLGPCIASAPRRDVAAAGADGLFTACAAIATAIDGVVRDGAAYWDGWMERIIEAYSAGGFPQTVAGSPRFRVYDTDFGFGRPAKVDVVSAARTGSISVAEALGGGGSGVEGSSSGVRAIKKENAAAADEDVGDFAALSDFFVP
uniref:Anthocyanin 5-aromatic acyltransferase n=1 Tax=Aegilops tauschii TaxID=37682 RepID=M8CR43_AEGTA